RLSVDGRLAALDEYAGGGRRVTVWDVAAGQVVFRRAPEKGAQLRCFWLSPGGKWLAIREDVGRRTLLRAYDTTTGKGKDLGDLEYNVYEIKFSADAHRVVVSQISAEGKGAFLSCFDVPAGKQLWKLPHKGGEFAVSP